MLVIIICGKNLLKYQNWKLIILKLDTLEAGLVKTLKFKKENIIRTQV